MLLVAAKRRGLWWTPECFDSFYFFCLPTQKGKFLIQTIIEESFYRTVFLTVWKKFQPLFEAILFQNSFKLKKCSA